MARSAVIDDVWVRIFSEDVEWRQKATGGTWRALPFTPPTETPGPDIDLFDDRNGVLDGSFTLNNHLRWTEGDQSPNNDTISIAGGVVGPGGVPVVTKRVVADFGVDASDVIRLTGVFGPDPASGNYVCGLAIVCDGPNVTTPGLHFSTDETFVSLYGLLQYPGAANLGGVVPGSAPTVGQKFTAELGPTDTGNYYFLGTLHNGNRFGPFILPAGYEDNTFHGLVFQVPFTTTTNVGRPISTFRCELGTSTFRDAPLLTAPFSNAAGTVAGVLSDQGHIGVRTGTTMEFSGTGYIYLNTAVAQNTPNVLAWPVPHRNLDITAPCMVVGNGSALCGPVAHVGASPAADHLMAAISETSGTLTLRKRVASTSTVLATVTGKTVDATFRSVRMAIKWPNVKVYYDDELSPSINYNLTSTDQSDLGGGTRQSCGVAITKATSVPSGQITSVNVAVEGAVDMSVYTTRVAMGTDNYEGNTFTSSAFPSDIASDGVREVVGSCKLISGQVVWGVRTRVLPTGSTVPAFGPWTEVVGIPHIVDQTDNHPSMSVAIDGSGRIHFFGGMHDDFPAQYAYSDPGYDLSTWHTPTFPTGMLTNPGAIDAVGNPVVGRYTYPQLTRLPNGNVVFTCRNKFSNTGQSQQGFFIYFHATNTFGNLVPGTTFNPKAASGVLINGDTVGGGGSDRGVYMGSFNQFFDLDSWGIMWLWAREVPDGTGEAPNPPGARRYYDINYLRTDTSGTTWQKSNGTTIPSSGAGPVVPGTTQIDLPLDLDESVNHGLDDDFRTWIDSAGRPAALIFVGGDYPTNPIRHLYRVDNTAWTHVPGPTVLRKRQICPFSYGGRDWALGRPTTAGVAVLVDLTIGSPKYGQVLLTVYDGPTVITSGWKPQIDRERLAATGHLCFIPRPSWNDGFTGAYQSIALELVDFDLAQAITDGIV